MIQPCNFSMILFGLLIALTSTAHAAWQTLYSSSSDLAYLHLRNNALLQIYADDANTTPLQLPDPPANATLALTKNETLLAFYGESFCTAIQVSKYSETDKSWVNITNKLVNAPNYLAQRIYISQPSSELIYIYGGRNMSDSCNVSYIEDPSTIYSSRADYLVSNEIHVFNTTNLTFSHLATASSPTAMFSAGVMRLSDYSSILIGGKAQNGWIGMNQLAIWQYSSWSFVSTAASSHVDSRTNPLVLPLKDPAGSGTTSGLNGTLVLGGQVNSHLSIPYAVGLSLNETTGWTWNSSLNQSLFSDPEYILGAVTFENTLLTITNSTADELTGDNKKRKRGKEEDYTVSFYNVNDWTQASGFTPSSDATDTAASDSSGTPTGTSTGTSKGTSTAASTAVSTAEPTTTDTSSSSLSSGGKIALSTVLPVSALFATLAAAGFLFYRKRKRDQNELFPAPRPLTLSPYFGSSGTFDNLSTGESQSRRTQSINSWTEKRRIYEEQEHYNQNAVQQFGGQTAIQQSYGLNGQQPYMPIDDTLGTSPGTDLGIIAIGEGVVDQLENPFYTVHDHQPPHQPPIEAPEPPTPVAAYKSIRTSTMRSASATLASYFMGRRSKSSVSVSVSAHPQNMTERNNIMSTQLPSPITADDAADADADEFFQGRDVQVLVSSKRRSRLRVTNPDPSTPSRTNSEHSTVASLTVKKTRNGKTYGQLNNTVPETMSEVRSASGVSISRQGSIGASLRKTSTSTTAAAAPRRESLNGVVTMEEPEEESDLTEVQMSGRMTSNGSAFGVR